MKKHLSTVFLSVVLLLSAISIGASCLLYKKIACLTKYSAVLLKMVIPEEEPREPQAPPSTTKNQDSSLCASLRSVPFGEDSGLIRSVKTLNIEGAEAPYNASLIPNRDGFLMVFRYDVKERKTVAGFKTPFRKKIPFPSQKMPFRSYIGAVRLNDRFEQVSEVTTIDTKSSFSEDPRIFTAGSDIYVSYNDMQENIVYSRSMRLAKIDPDTLKPIFVSDIDQHINFVEKNWVPFVHNEKGKEVIHFGYGINPHKVLRMQSPESNQMDHLIFPHTATFQKLPWPEKKWGVLRGGTPAILVDGQYLAFFHTLFYENKRPWYVMGAYTFEAAPPYRVTAVSAEPILFKGIYDTKARNTAHSKKKAIYPAGAVLGKEGDTEVIHVTCGENDSAIKLVTFDKKALIDSLSKVVPYIPKTEATVE